MSFRRRMMAANSKPYDAEIEYLESTGYTYINLGISAKNTTKFDFSVMATDSQTGFLFGSRVAASNKTFDIFCKYQSGATDNGIRWDYNTASIRNANVLPLNNKIRFNNLSSPNILKYSSYSLSATNVTFSNGVPMHLMGLNLNNTGHSNGPNGCRYYYFKLYDNSTLLLDLIPVRKGGIGYMYDKISGQLFGNAGSGEFILGKDIYRYVQDGLVGMWDAIDNAGYGIHNNNASSWIDLSGNGRNLTINEGTSWDEKSFITNTDFSIAATCSDMVPILSNITQELVFKPIDYNSSSGRITFFKTGPTVLNGDYQMMMRGLAYNRNRSIYGWMPKANSVYTDNAQYPTKNKDYAVVTCYRASNSLTDNPTKFIVNGVTKSSITADGWASANNFMFIGGFYGKVYAIRIYNRVLTDDEIAKNHNLDVMRFSLNQ